MKFHFYREIRKVGEIRLSRANPEKVSSRHPQQTAKPSQTAPFIRCVKTESEKYVGIAIAFP